VSNCSSISVCTLLTVLSASLHLKEDGPISFDNARQLEVIDKNENRCIILQISKGAQKSMDKIALIHVFYTDVKNPSNIIGPRNVFINGLTAHLARAALKECQRGISMCCKSQNVLLTDNIGGTVAAPLQR
jgi:hypothetical protein